MCFPFGAVLAADALVRNVADVLQGPYMVSFRFPNGHYYGRFLTRCSAEFALAILKSYERLNVELRRRDEKRASILNALDPLTARCEARRAANQRVMAKYYTDCAPYIYDEVQGLRRNVFGEEMLKSYRLMKERRDAQYEARLVKLSEAIGLGLPSNYYEDNRTNSGQGGTH